MVRYAIIVLIAALLCSGCASFGRGLAEGVMKEGSRPGECRIYSAGFDGVEKAFDDHASSLKILNIHGIGEHNPGYGLALMDKLAEKMNLTVQAPDYKEILLSDPALPGVNIGTLRVYKRYSDGGDIMLFYEYSWSVISKPLKQELNFDQNDASAMKRTGMNASLKVFFNEIAPDAVIYSGNPEYQSRIYAGLNQSMCWMTEHNWEDLPNRGNVTCIPADSIPDDMYKHRHILLASSMGSQIALDSMHRLIYDSVRSEEALDRANYSEIPRLDFQIFMLSNQIPLLSLGHKRAMVTNRIDEFCSPEGASYNYRFLDNFKIVAFSDPNDILTYTLSPEFISENVDSRFCPEVSNIVLNVAPVVNMAGVTEFVNPFYAHKNYDKTDRILDLIVHGTEPKMRDTDPKDDCQWLLLK